MKRGFLPSALLVAHHVLLAHLELSRNNAPTGQRGDAAGGGAGTTTTSRHQIHMSRRSREITSSSSISSFHAAPSGLMFAAAQSTSKTSANRQKLEALRAESVGQVIRLQRDDVATYKQIALDKEEEKDYHLLVLYTLPASSNPKSCPMCGPLFEAFQRVADSYADKAVFFLLVELGPISHLHQVQRIPQLSHVGKSYSETFEQKGKIHQFLYRTQFFGDPEPEKLLHWVNSASGESVRLRQTFMEQVTSVVVILLFFALLGAIAKFAIASLQNCPEIMAVLSLAIAALGMSGIMYNIINKKMQLFGVTRDGGFELLVPSSRGQHLGEGLLFGACFVLVGSGFAFLARARPVPTAQRKREELAQRTRQTLMVLLCCFAIMTFVESSYKQKSGWTMPTPFFPPPHFKQGPITVDQGTSF